MGRFLADMVHDNMMPCMPTTEVCNSQPKLASSNSLFRQAAHCTFTIHAAFNLSHLKKKIGRFRHMVVARVRNSPTRVLCLAVSGLPAPSSLETLNAYRQA